MKLGDCLKKNWYEIIKYASSRRSDYDLSSPLRIFDIEIGEPAIEIAKNG